AGGLSLTPTPAYTDNTTVGTATASYTFAGDANHDGSTSSATFTIGKAGSTTSVSCPTTATTYTGAALAVCSATVTGAGGLSLTRTPGRRGETTGGTAAARFTFE